LKSELNENSVTENRTFNTGNGPFNTGNGPFNTGNGPFNTENVPFNTENGSFNTENGLFNTGNGTSETGNRSFSTDNGPLNTENVSFNTGNSFKPFPSQEKNAEEIVSIIRDKIGIENLKKFKYFDVFFFVPLYLSLYDQTVKRVSSFLDHCQVRTDNFI
jgi:hypothetical protein